VRSSITSLSIFLTRALIFVICGTTVLISLSIFRSNNWRHVASRPKRPLRSIVLDPGIKDLLIDDAKDFLESKQWYADRGIPFRRGYLLVRASHVPLWSYKTLN
jgi:hypothetical protein